jgi:hypothetical protein
MRLPKRRRPGVLGSFQWRLDIEGPFEAGLEIRIEGVAREPVGGDPFEHAPPTARGQVGRLTGGPLRQIPREQSAQLGELRGCYAASWRQAGRDRGQAGEQLEPILERTCPGEGSSFRVQRPSSDSFLGAQAASRPQPGGLDPVHSSVTSKRTGTPDTRATL